MAKCATETFELFGCKVTVNVIAAPGETVELSKVGDYVRHCEGGSLLPGQVYRVVSIDPPFAVVEQVSHVPSQGLRSSISCGKVFFDTPSAEYLAAMGVDVPDEPVGDDLQAG